MSHQHETKDVENGSAVELETTLFSPSISLHTPKPPQIKP